MCGLQKQVLQVQEMRGGAVKWELSLAESKMGETWSDEALLY